MHRHTKIWTKALLFPPVVLLWGCTSPMALHHDYDDYSEVYADASNRQLLLNLARESQEQAGLFHPTRFDQLPVSIQHFGRVSPRHRVDPASISGATAAMIPSLVPTFPHPGRQFEHRADPDPVFQFFPLSGTNFVQAILPPFRTRSS